MILVISSLSPIHFMRRDIKYEFWEENEVVIQEILERLENLKKWILTVSFQFRNIFHGNENPDDFISEFTMFSTSAF